MNNSMDSQYLLAIGVMKNALRLGSMSTIRQAAHELVETIDKITADPYSNKKKAKFKPMKFKIIK